MVFGALVVRLAVVCVIRVGFAEFTRFGGVVCKLFMLIFVITATALRFGSILDGYIVFRIGHTHHDDVFIRSLISFPS